MTGAETWNTCTFEGRASCLPTWHCGVLVLSNTQFSGPSLMLGTTSASFYQIPFLLLDLASPFLSLAIKGTVTDSRVVSTNVAITQRWGYQNIMFFITLYLILTFNLSLHTHPLIHTECFLKCIRKDKEKNVYDKKCGPHIFFLKSNAINHSVCPLRHVSMQLSVWFLILIEYLLYARNCIGISHLLYLLNPIPLFNSYNTPVRQALTSHLQRKKIMAGRLL